MVSVVSFRPENHGHCVVLVLLPAPVLCQVQEMAKGMVNQGSPAGEKGAKELLSLIDDVRSPSTCALLDTYACARMDVCACGHSLCRCGRENRCQMKQSLRVRRYSRTK